MHQEDVLRSGLVWVEIGGVRKFKFFNRGVVGYFNLTSVNPRFKKLELSAEDTWPLFRRGALEDKSRRCASVWVGLG